MNNKVKTVLQSIIEQFKSGDIPEAIAYSMFPIPDIPSGKWSLLNRTIMFLSGTQDARGFRQWQHSNRFVKKGSKAIYILVPFIKKDDADGRDDKKPVLKGFGVKPIFRMEDTDGEPLDYQEIELPELPLIEKAKDWGISVKAIPGNYSYYGYFSSSRKEIALATSEESVFFHELAHSAHDIVSSGLKGGQHPLQEIIAELSASALCRMVGKKQTNTLGNSFRYIESYAEQLKMSACSACLKVMSDTEKVLNLIINGETPKQQETA